MRRPRHATAAVHSRVSIPEIAEELGVTQQRVRKLLAKHGWWIGDGRRITAKRHSVVTYDKDVIEKLRGLLDQPHRQLEEPESDWLSRYLGGTNA